VCVCVDALGSGLRVGVGVRCDGAVE
jgi:hypothetical protein